MKPQRISPCPNSMHIPEDLLNEVLLPRLSVKSLSRMKGVSKAFHAIITSSEHFKTLQSQRPTPASTGFVYSNNRGLSFLPNSATIGVPDPSLKFLVKSPKDVYLLSSTNGLLLFYAYGGVNSLRVTNPATMKTEIVSNAPTGSIICMGLAFNPLVVPLRFAIVGAIWSSEFGNIKYMFNVFQSTTGNWNRSEQVVYVSHSSRIPATPVCAQGVLYWCCIDYLLWYDHEKDSAGTIPLPYRMEEKRASMEVSAMNDEIFCTCVTFQGELEVWKLTREAEWERLHKLTMEKIIDVSPQKLYFGLPGDEVARERRLLRYYVSALAFDGRSIYVAIKPKIWQRGKALMARYTPTSRYYMLSRLYDHLDAGNSIRDFDINIRSVCDYLSRKKMSVYDEFDYESEFEVDLWCCDVITGEVINIGSRIPTHDNWRLQHYHNSIVAVPPIQSPNI